MYLNFDVISKNEFIWQDNLFLCLVALKNKVEIGDDMAELLILKGFAIRRGNKVTPTKDAIKLLKDCQIAGISDESKGLAQDLIEMYENNGKKVMNKKKVLELLSWFLSETNFSHKTIISVVENYLLTTQPKYISELHNLIWKPENVFSTKWTLSNSKLYGLIINSKNI